MSIASIPAAQIACTLTPHLRSGILKSWFGL